MERLNRFTSEFHGQTTLHPLGLAAVVALGLAMLLVRRQYAVWPMIMMACFVASAQRIVVAGADFDLLRIMVIFGTIRVVLRNEYAGFTWNRLDTVLVLWGLAAAAFPIIRIGPDILVNRLGHLYDVFGMYFLFRCLIRTWDDLAGVARGLMWVSLPVAVFFAVEWSTGRNIFSIFGGVPAVTVVRDGRLRCQGAFSHAILAGCFWAAALPLMASQWWRGSKWLTAASCSAALFIVFACASATPVLGVLTGIIGSGLIYFRRNLRVIRWGLVLLLICLHMVMKAPVWHLISRISLGGSSYHRYALIDGAINHFYEWWLVGSYVGTGHWGHHTFDVTNYYIVQGIQGGIVQLGLFLLLIGMAFGGVGRTLRASAWQGQLPIFPWALGVCLLVHTVNFIGVSYFGQIIMSFYMVLGAIGSLGAIAPVAPGSRVSV